MLENNMESLVDYYENASVYMYLISEYNPDGDLTGRHAVLPAVEDSTVTTYQYSFYISYDVITERYLYDNGVETTPVTLDDIDENGILTLELGYQPIG